ncbi:MAG: DUF1439 domain-containing protein [Armatimonadetes bacterium]|nr:DUF1439 domain-containing protein [Armatimonadota bacterium]
MPRSRWFCCCLPGCLVAVVVPFAALGWFFYMGTQPPADAPPARTFTPVEVKTAREKIETLKAHAEKSFQAAEKGKRQPFKFVITERDLNAYLNRDPELAQKLRDQGIEDPWITLNEGKAAVQGRLPVKGQRLWLRVEGALHAGENGRILFEPSGVEFGRLRMLVPPAMRDEILKQIRREAQGAVFRVPGEIQELKITGGKLVLRGVTDPKAVEAMKRDAEERGRSGPG